MVSELINNYLDINPFLKQDRFASLLVSNKFSLLEGYKEMKNMRDSGVIKTINGSDGKLIIFK